MQTLINILFGVQTAFAQANTADKSKEFDVIAFIIEKFPYWITALVVIVIFTGIAFVIKKTVESRLASQIDESHQEVMIISGRVSFILVALIGITIGLTVAGIDLTALLAAVAFGISFGLQDTISNFVAGMALLASRPFSIGDWIHVGGNVGRVAEIRTRATYLINADGHRIIVPNADLYKTTVRCTTANALRRIRVPVYTRFGISFEEVTKVCIGALKKHSVILLEPKPSLVIIDLGDYYVELQLRFWVVTGTPWYQLRAKLMGELETILEQSNLAAPYPITSLSTEEDVEFGVMQVQNLTKEEVEKKLQERQNYYQDMDKRRIELLQEERNITATAADQEGADFLKRPEAVIPTANRPRQEQSQPLAAVEQQPATVEQPPAT